MAVQATASELLVLWGPNLLVGVVSTIEISFCSYALGFGLGLVGAVGKLNGGATLQKAFGVYTTLGRSLPELLLIVMLYYLGTSTINQVLAQFEIGAIHISGFVAAVAVLGVIQGAYQTEVLRGAILAIPIGQIEAAKAYGMSPLTRFRRIVLPALLPNAIPGLSNLWLNATKDSALVAVVGYSELMLQTRQAAGGTKRYMLFYVVAALLYLVISTVSLKGFALLDGYVRRGQPKVT
jgi:polar amino acid transport system permease protein